jgi:glyoxylase-like metal-dependent hydrolase (beta-lactamase superfamily II)
MQRSKLSIIGLAAAALAMPVLAQQRPGPLTLSVHALKGGAYWVEGGVSNTGFVVGDKGVVVIDPQMSSEAAQKVLAEIARITPKPANTVVISHSDPDHVGGLPGYPAGTTIVMHENTRSVIRASAADASGGPMLGAMYNALLPLLPTRTVSSTETMVVDGVRLVLIHPGLAHTSGDLIVYLPAQKVVFAADLLVSSAQFPVIHIDGSSLGWIEGIKAMLALNTDTYVAGHGSLMTKAMVRKHLRDAELRREQVKALVNQNKSLAEVQQALPETPVDPRFKTFTRVVYEELTQGYPPVHPPWANMTWANMSGK